MELVTVEDMDWSEFTENSFRLCKENNISGGFALTTLYGYAKVGNIAVMFIGCYSGEETDYIDIIQCQIGHYEDNKEYICDYGIEYYIYPLEEYHQYRQFQRSVVSGLNRILSATKYLRKYLYT